MKKYAVGISKEKNDDDFGFYYRYRPTLFKITNTNGSFAYKLSQKFGKVGYTNKKMAATIAKQKANQLHYKYVGHVGNGTTVK